MPRLRKYKIVHLLKQFSMDNNEMPKEQMDKLMDRIKNAQ